MRSPSQQPRIIRVFISFALRATRDLVSKPTVNIEIPDDIMRATHPTPTELRVETAVMPFEEEKPTLGRAAELVDVGHLSFSACLPAEKFRFTAMSKISRRT